MYGCQQVKRVADADSFLRVVVDSGGCSGFQYKFELDNTLHDDDRFNSYLLTYYTHCGVVV